MTLNEIGEYLAATYPNVSFVIGIHHDAPSRFVVSTSHPGPKFGQVIGKGADLQTAVDEMFLNLSQVESLIVERQEILNRLRDIEMII
jgi:hypothetical protein